MPAATQLLAFGLRQVIDVTPDVVENVAGMAADVLASAARPARSSPWFGSASPTTARRSPRRWRRPTTGPGKRWPWRWPGAASSPRSRSSSPAARRKALHEQVEAFLAQNADGFPGTSREFRQTCLRELRQAEKAGLLAAGQPDPEGWARQAAAYRGLADPQGRIAEAHQAAAAVADALPEITPTWPAS